ncbi:phospholipase D-like domain-containing protein [Akkermansia sp.]|uniref:phospholipase D-like domain-containing protein n=1 Tax=Akkermansia sp. TaxID=1872421 RepID=UPI0025C36EC9|nr:phospholipase D-like domain-containing protein [Akkermansia sp.]MCC8147754.1 phospholipase D family protein [Akkermansia sp.]
MVTRANKGRYPSEHYLLLQTIEKYKGTLIELNQHAKIYLIDAHPDYYSIVGSANMTKNESLEQAVIINDKKIYDFYRSIFDHFNKTK